MTDERRLRLRRMWILLGIAALVWASVGIAGATLGAGAINRVELPLSRWFNGCLGHNEAFDRIVLFFNRTPGEGSSVAMIFVAYVLVARWAKLSVRSIVVQAIVVFIVWVAANQLNELILPFVPRRSPGLVLKDDFVDLTALYGPKIKTRTDDCFPSNHGIVFFTVFWMAACTFGKRGLVLLPLCILLSLPRVFGGGHWLSDNLVGAAFIALPLAALATGLPGAGGVAGSIERWLARRRAAKAAAHSA